MDGGAILWIGILVVVAILAAFALQEQSKKGERVRSMDLLLKPERLPVGERKATDFALNDQYLEELDTVDRQYWAICERVTELHNQQDAILESLLLSKGDFQGTPEEWQRTCEEAQEKSERLSSQVDVLIAQRDELNVRQDHLSEKRAALFAPQKRSEIEDTFTGAGSQPAFQTDRKFLGVDALTGIALDKSNKQFALLTAASMDIVPFSKLLSCEIVVDSDSIVKTDRAGQIGGAIVGGVLTGGFGAVVMAMGAKKKQIQKIRRIELKVLTKTIEKPSHSIVFYDNPQGGDGSFDMQKAVEWQDMISVAIHDAVDSVPRDGAAKALVASSSSVADELKKLLALKNDGALTDEEFVILKKQLVNSQ